MGQLKRVKRSGWWIAGVENPESVAEHSFRTAAIAYLLAKLEGADAGRVTLMALFHDMGEARTNDLHRIVRRYVNWENVDQQGDQGSIEKASCPYLRRNDLPPFRV